MIAHHKDWLGLVTGMWMNMNDSEPKVLWPHAFLDILFIPCHFSFMTQDLDPRMVCWKGAAILACLDTTQEMWITQREWKQFSVRMLRERAPFMWWKRRAATFLKQCHKSRDVAFFLLPIRLEGEYCIEWLTMKNGECSGKEDFVMCSLVKCISHHVVKTYWSRLVVN